MGDLKARFTGVPIGLVRICLPSFRSYSQQLPLPFAIHQQLLTWRRRSFRLAMCSWTYGRTMSSTSQLRGVLPSSIAALWLTHMVASRRGVRPPISTIFTWKCSSFIRRRSSRQCRRVATGSRMGTASRQL